MAKMRIYNPSKVSRVLGLSSPFSMSSYEGLKSSNVHLADGSLAILDGDEIALALVEERWSRTRYSGGFRACLKSLPRHFSMKAPDVIAFSSCCGPKWLPNLVLHELHGETLAERAEWLLENHPQIVVVGHHDSHASLGFVLSGFDRALVAVIDGFGNLLDQAEWSPTEWWKGCFERHSYYLAEWGAKGFSLTKVASDCPGTTDVSAGELYHGLTHYCGWSSYQQAGCAMALAAYGSSLRSTGPIFIGIEQGMVKVKMSSKHLDAGEAFSETLRQYGTQPQPIYGRSATPKDKHHSDVARTVQDELEVALCERIGRLAERLSVDNVVVSGGVALNCLAMGRLLKTLQRSVFVPPAPADTGQALGNALWARYAIQSPAHCGLGPPKFPMSPFWGIRPDQDDIATAVALLCEHGMQVTACDCSNQLAKSAARLLSEGKTVATCMGKSEYGPRALGGRSVLADSRNPNSPDRVNLFKCREEFRPFAPSVLNTCISDYFTTSPCSPYMSFAATVRHAATKVIPAVVHKDLSARVHTVTDNSGSPLFSILTHFNALTNVPVLLNTSFNRHGEPIVEKAQDAARAFAESSLDALLLDGFMIERPSLAMR